MNPRDLMEQAAATVVALSVVGGGALWLFREKIAAHHDRRLVKSLGGDPDEHTPREALAQAIDGRVNEWRHSMEEEQAQLGSRMSEQERSSERIARAFESAAAAIGEGVQRLTTQVERIAESHEETRETVAHIRGWVDGQKGAPIAGGGAR